MDETLIMFLLYKILKEVVYIMLFMASMVIQWSIQLHVLSGLWGILDEISLIWYQGTKL